MKRISLLLLFVAVLATPAWAADTVVPALFRGNGANGTQWRTELVITNGLRTLAPQQVTLRLFRTGGTTDVRTFTLMPYQSLTWRDALPELFGVENGGGMLLISYANEPGSVHARARVYNTTASGEYGQSMRGIAVSRLLPEADLIGLSNANGNRTNVGIANPHNAPVVVWLSLVDSDGTGYGVLGLEVGPRSVTQLNDVFASFLNTRTFDGAHIHVVSDVPLYSYASVVRSDSGDATFVEPQ